jgi:uroporphyrin-III C-methyltransferase/precorrin-2 dehydrogenase/sirohydrochlorin ferrochelatase
VPGVDRPAGPGAPSSPGTPGRRGAPSSPGTPGGRDAPVYPLSLHLAGRRVLVVGGGPVALRRVAGLRAAGAEVVVVAPELTPALADLAARGLITARQRPYQPSDIDGAWLVLACTNQPTVNAGVTADAERRRVWCVRADDAAASPAWVPAAGRAAGVTVAVNAGGNPKRAAWLRDRCLAAVAQAEGPAGRSSAQRPADGPGPAAAGSVAIVGGGPGDPGLITLAGWERLRQADVVVADRLGPLALLDELPPGVEVIDAAKVPGGPAMRQERINQALIEHARAGRAVVRLKGGDPYVFGRGREEVEACLAAGVPVSVVPGVTSATAVPAAAGIPVTHRGASPGFCVVAGHPSGSGPARRPDWAALARSGLTLVLLMAVEELAGTAAALLAGGMDPDTPAACVCDGWSRQQRVVTARLADLAEAARDGGVANPAVIVIGDVARFASGQGARLTAGPAPAPGRAEGSPAPPARRLLVLGGTRSGKSATAESLLADAGPVDYLATGEPPGKGDAEWDARVREHQRRRPRHWRTVETLAVAEYLTAPSGAAPVLVDCLTVWLARVMDACGVWERRPGADADLAWRVDALVAAWQHTTRRVVAVSNEVGAGVVPESPAGRRFRDELGLLNSRIAAASDEVWYCTAGIARRLR